MDQRCYRGNRPAHTTETMFQASVTWDPWDKPSISSKKAQHEPPYSLHQHFLCSEKGEISDQTTRKEMKKKQRRLEHEWARNVSGSIPATNVNAPNVAKGLSRTWVIISFNCDKMDHYATSVLSQRKTETSQKTSDSLDDLHFNDRSSLLPWNAFLLFDIRFKSEKIEKKLGRSRCPERSR